MSANGKVFVGWATFITTFIARCKHVSFPFITVLMFLFLEFTLNMYTPLAWSRTSLRLWKSGRDSDVLQFLYNWYCIIVPVCCIEFCDILKFNWNGAIWWNLMEKKTRVLFSIISTFFCCFSFFFFFRVDIEVVHYRFVTSAQVLPERVRYCRNQWKKSIEPIKKQALNCLSRV